VRTPEESEIPKFIEPMKPLLMAAHLSAPITQNHTVPLKSILIGILAGWLSIGCSPSNSPETSHPTSTPEINTPDSLRTQSPDVRQRHVAFLNKIRQADPQFNTIDKAILNEENELALILDRSVQMNSIPALMKTMLTQMAKEFPDQDLTVIAYTPSNPPKKIGTAHLNARTRDMTYTPVATP
jgi:hypothetical protein